MTQRRLHTDSRTSENFTEDGLRTLTGQSQKQWRRYVTKELLDNALEAVDEAERTPRIDVTVTYPPNSGHAKSVRIEDNGPGIDELETIFADPDTFAGSKRHYALPTRGNQGNALMTVLGIQHLVGEPLRIETRGDAYEIRATQDPLEDKHRVVVDHVGESDVKGTAIEVRFGDRWVPRYSRQEKEVVKTLKRFAVLNPHAEFSITVHDGESEMYSSNYRATEEPTVQRLSLPSTATTGKAHWFSLGEFEERLEADARAAPELTVGEFVQEFKGLTSRSKRDAVLDDTEIAASTTLRELYRDGTHTNEIPRLYRAMCAETATYSERGVGSSVGSVGDDLATRLVESVVERDSAQQLLTDLKDREYIGPDADLSDLTAHYRDGGVYSESDGEKVVPYYFEIAVVPVAAVDSDSRGGEAELAFGVNQSPVYSEPTFDGSLEIRYQNAERRKFNISAAIEQLDHHYHVVCNLTCPNVDFQDKGKQAFDTDPFHETIADVVGKAARKIERDIRPGLNKLTETPTTEPRELKGKAPQGFVKNTVRDLLTPVYHEVTDGGRLTVTMRQLFYAVRPKFQAVAERHGYEYASKASRADPTPLELNDDYFSDVVAEFEEEVWGERRVHREKRGFFVEPHTNREIDLSTKKVREYTPDLDQYGTLLFVEKRGFYELIHKELELTKKYDIGLVNAQGYGTLACKSLIEKIQAADPSVTLLLLTDLDIPGLGIADAADTADVLSEISAQQAFNAERIGITLEDVHEYDLETESRNYNDGQITELQNRVADGTVDPQTAEFLLENGGQAVEINAIGPTDLGPYLEDKLQARGIEKVAPGVEDVDVPDVPDSEDIRERAIEQAVGEYVLSALSNENVHETLRQAISEDGPDGVAPGKYAVDAETVQSRITDALAERPAKQWTDLNEEFVTEIEDEAESDIEEYEDRVREDVLSRLDEHASIDIDLTLPVEERAGD